MTRARSAQEASTMPDQTAAPREAGTTPADLDRMLHAWQSRFTAGHSPSTVSLAFLDWAAHAFNAPFQTAALSMAAMEQWRRLARITLGAEPPLPLPPGDHRFSNPAWAGHPYAAVVRAVLLGEQWCRARAAPMQATG
jgi:polyhydroxyalkanoate synthase